MWEDWQSSSITHATQTANSKNGKFTDYHTCVFCNQKIKEGDELTFDYNQECDEYQNMTESKCMPANCKGFIERVWTRMKK